MTSSIDWQGLLNLVASSATSSTAATILKSVLVVATLVFTYLLSSKIKQAQVDNATNQTNQTNNQVNTDASTQSNTQENTVTQDQQNLENQEKAQLLAFLGSLTDSQLIQAAISAYTASKVQTALGVDPSTVTLLSQPQREAIYGLYGV